MKGSKKEIETKSILPNTQTGFSKGRGTVDNIYTRGVRVPDISGSGRFVILRYPKNL